LAPLVEENAMTFLTDLIHNFLHLDSSLQQVINDYGVWTYAILFLIIFCETGLVITPFLPGDSLLFAIGTFAAQEMLQLRGVVIILLGAAILGDTVNYGIGFYLAPRVLRHQRIRFVKQEYIDRTQRFYEKHGGKTIIIARFIPIIRTFAPFLAGVGRMQYGRFLFYNVIGGVLWVVGFVFAGYFFGNLPFIKENFTLAIMVIIVVSLIPAGIEWLRSRKEAVS
jgi:membrane-associated protein